MKIRTDFVTNSSSVSYIITMKEDMVKIYLKCNKGSLKNGEDYIANFLIKNIIEKGTRVFIEGEEIYTRKVDFDTNDTMIDSSLELPPEQMDFSSMDEEKLWEYIYGEYILEGSLKNIWGFGITQTKIP